MVQRQVAIAQSGEQAGGGFAGAKPTQCAFGAFGSGDGVEQRLEPEGVPLVGIAEQFGELVGEHATGAAVFVVEPVLVAAVAADRARVGAGAGGAERLVESGVGQQPPMPAASGTVAFGAHPGPVALGADRAVGPFGGDGAAVAAVAARAFRPGLAAGTQHPAGALAEAGSAAAAAIAGRDWSAPTAPAKVRFVVGGGAGDDGGAAAAPAGALRPWVAPPATRCVLVAHHGQGAAAGAGRGGAGRAALAGGLAVVGRGWCVEPAVGADREGGLGAFGAGGLGAGVGVDGGADSAGRAAFLRVPVAAGADDRVADPEPGAGEAAADTAGPLVRGIGVPARITHRSALLVAAADQPWLSAARARRPIPPPGMAADADALPVVAVVP